MDEHKKRGLSSDDARKVRQAGHDDAKAFALAIGLTEDYQNDKKAKKDVIDPSGDAHSVKSGNKKWQIFLYGAERFRSDSGFAVMNGLGDLLLDCINSFPQSFYEYGLHKNFYKQRLQIPMRAICAKLQDPRRIKAFFEKALFNSGEVNYLTIKHDNKYHVFAREDVIDALTNNLVIENSKAFSRNQMDDQKVIFKHNGKNLAELEMRNDSEAHFREIRFNMLKPRAMDLFFDFIKQAKPYNPEVIAYGKAIRRFGRWKNS